MRETRIQMGMPVTIEVVGTEDAAPAQAVFGYFDAVDRRFSTYKSDSEISAINAGRVRPEAYSLAMQEVFALAEQTRRETDGFFDIRRPDGTLDPSGLVKGWAIQNAAALLIERGVENFFIDAGGDIQSAGRNSDGIDWRVGIRNPFDAEEIVKIVFPLGHGVATSGSYVRGDHIYDPHAPHEVLETIVSLTVIGPNVLEADRFATAAFAMGQAGIAFIEHLPGFEAYAIDRAGIATRTSGFDRFTRPT